MKIGPQPDSTFWNIRESLISCCGGLSRLTVSFNRFQILKFSCLAEFGLRKGMQMVNTVLEDQKLLIQYLSNISWSHSFTKCKQPISIMPWTQYSKRWPWLRWWGDQAAFGLRWYQSGHHDIGGYAVCTLVVECAHWLCSAHIGCGVCTLVVVQRAHCAHWSPLIARESHFRQLDLATLLLVRFPDPLADALWVRGWPCNSQSHTLLLMHIWLQSQSWLILFVWDFEWLTCQLDLI